MTYLGADKPIVAKSGRHQDNVFKENKFSGKGESVKLKETDGTQLLGNRFQKADKIRFYDSKDIMLKDNTGLGKVEVKVTHSSCFDKKCDDGFEPMC